MCIPLSLNRHLLLLGVWEHSARHLCPLRSYNYRYFLLQLEFPAYGYTSVSLLYTRIGVPWQQLIFPSTEKLIDTLILYSVGRGTITVLVIKRKTSYA